MEVSLFIDKHSGYLSIQKKNLKALSNLSEEVLTQKPAENAWSIAECILHMLLATRPYLDRIEKEISNSKNEATPKFKRGILGKYFTYGMLPKNNGEIKNKIKTMSWFDPGKSKKYTEYNQLSAKQLINEFQLVLDKLSSSLKSSSKLNLNKHKIVSTLGPIIQFKLGDAFAFTIAHNERHLHQINRIKSKLSINE